MKKLGAAVMALVVILIAFHPSPLRAGEVETVRFGVVFSLRGEFGSLGRMHLAGVRMRMDAFNRDAERHGFRLEMLLRDDKSDPALAQLLTAELMDDPSVVAIVGTTATSTCIPILPIVRDGGGVFITPSVTNDIVGKFRDGSFRVLPSDTFQGEALGRFIRERLGLGRAALVANEGYEYSRAVSRAFSRTFEAEGGSMVASEYYAREREGEVVDFDALFDEISAARPEAVLMAVYAEDLLTMLATAKRKKLDVVFCGSDTWMENTVASLAAETVERTYYIGLGDDNAESPALRAFLSALDETADPAAEKGSMAGWDAVTLLAEGLRLGRTREALRENMYRLGEVDLASGKIAIDGDGIKKPTYIMKAFMKDGKAVAELAEIARPYEPKDGAR